MSEREREALKARDEAVNKARKAYAEATNRYWEVLKEALEAYAEATNRDWEVFKEALAQAEKAYDETVTPAKKEEQR